MSAEKKFNNAGIDDARLNAEYLASHVLCKTGRSDWRLHSRAEVNPVQEKQYDKLIERRLGREPLQYILGEWEFYGLPLFVRPGVLIPRPETEILVEEAVREAVTMRPDSLIVDGGTGSGAIALALASKRPNSHVYGYDISDEALMVARENQRRLELKNVSFARSDMLSNDWLGEFEGTIDLFVSNPPYVSLEDFHALDPELRLYEPRDALTDNANGLTFYKALVKHARRLLAPNAKFLVELGYNVCDDVIQLVEADGLQVIRIVKDLANIERVLVAERAKD